VGHVRRLPQLRLDARRRGPRDLGAGRLWRVGADPAGGGAIVRATEIPFQAEVRKTVHEAVRFQHEVHPDRFEARMIRDAVTSADGQWLVFNAVGSIWRKRLPNGTPEQLSPAGQHAFFPAISPDSRTVAYVGWTDDDLAAIYAIPLAGGTPRPLTQTVPATTATRSSAPLATGSCSSGCPATATSAPSTAPSPAST
jgi:hypothetical protein